MNDAPRLSAGVAGGARVGLPHAVFAPAHPITRGRDGQVLIDPQPQPGLWQWQRGDVEEMARWAG